MKPTVVTLGPNSVIKDVVTFEDAFGDFSTADGEYSGADAEYSELKGRGRQRRADRRADRQEKKRARKADKQKTRQERRMTRIKNRAERKAARQEMRAAQQEARQSRKDVRKSRKEARKAMGDTPDSESEESGSENQNEQPENDAKPKSDYTPQAEQDNSSNEQETSISEQSNNSNNQVGGVFAYEEDEQPEDEADIEDAGDYDYTDEQYESEFDGGLREVSPGVQDAANKIEWNEELIDRLEDQREYSNANGEMGNASKLDDQLEARYSRLDELESQLEGYEYFEGDFTVGADGDYSYVKGKPKKAVSKKEAKLRRAEVKAAIKKAKKARFEAKEKAKQAKAKIKANKLAKKVKQFGGDVTPVDLELNPEFSKNRIEIPAEETAGFDGNGTGLNALDYAEDFDAPVMNEFDFNSSFEGDSFSYADGKSKINFVGILIGAALGIGAIYAINKYKLLK